MAEHPYTAALQAAGYVIGGVAALIASAVITLWLLFMIMATVRGVIGLVRSQFALRSIRRSK